MTTTAATDHSPSERPILVVDDEPHNVTPVIELLREMKLGGKVLSAPNGKVGLELARRFGPRLILTDWQMPVMDGLELARALRDDETTRGIPVVMISAIMTDAESMRLAFDAGVRDFLRKPFVDLEFVARVRNTLELQASLDAIAAKNQALQDAVAHQQSLNRLKDQIFSVISHDFRSPLATMTMMAGVQARLSGASSSDRAVISERMLSHLNRTMALLDNLLRWSVASVSGTPASRALVNIFEIVKSIFELHADGSTTKGIQLLNEVPPSIVVHANSDMLSFILRNLIANAIKFSSEEGTVVVRCADERTDAGSAQLTISVIDDGTGMTEAVRRSLFKKAKVDSQPGTQGETGTGIGLVFVNDFVQRLGGAIKVDTRPGGGSAFHVTIPTSP